MEGSQKLLLMKIQQQSKIERLVQESIKTGKPLLSKVQKKVLAQKDEPEIIEIPEVVRPPVVIERPPTIRSTGGLKIAFCLFGIIGGRQGKDGLGGDADFARCFDTYNDRIFKLYDTDVFLHTWSVQYEKPIIKLYQPKGAIFEPQIMFDGGKGPNRGDRFRSMSRWYSTMKVLELQRQYSERHNIHYDFIMLTRFDIMWLVPLNFEKLERDCFYIANWNLHKSSGLRGNASFPHGKMKRYSDMWMIGSQEQMNHLSGLYNVIGQIGNHEFDQHALLFTRMAKYREMNCIRFKYLNSIDYALYRKHVLGCTI